MSRKAAIPGPWFICCRRISAATAARRRRSCWRAIPATPTSRVRAAGAIDLATLQRYLNFWFSSSLDLFGSDQSSTAAASFANALKGRPDEARYEDHAALDQACDIDVPDGAGGARMQAVPMRN